MNRKQRRAMEKKMGKENSEKMADQLVQFGKLPEQCLACTKPYDKSSKEMAMTWNVVVQDSDTVRLYCPECWTMALKVIEDFKEKKENDG
jgi:hypothetical protein